MIFTVSISTLLFPGCIRTLIFNLGLVELCQRWDRGSNHLNVANGHLNVANGHLNVANGHLNVSNGLLYKYLKNRMFGAKRFQCGPRTFKNSAVL